MEVDIQSLDAYLKTQGRHIGDIVKFGRNKFFVLKTKELNGLYLIKPHKKGKGDDRPHDVYKLQYADTFHGSLTNTIEMLKADEAAQRINVERRGNKA